jgi:hypothetical protein
MPSFVRSSYLDAAGVWPTNADRYMGHRDASVAGRYRHAFPGQLEADAALLDSYLGGETFKVVRLAG